MGAALIPGLGTQGGAGGKSLGGQPQGPQMGFGFDPATGMPFGQAGQTLNDGLNSAFGGLPGVMPLVNTAGQVANTAFGGLANGIQGNQPATDMGQNLGNVLSNVVGFGGQMLGPVGGAFGQALDQTGMGGGKGGFGAGQPQGQPQMGFGMPAGGYGNDMGQVGNVLGTALGGVGQLLGQSIPGLGPAALALGQGGNVAGNVLNAGMGQPGTMPQGPQMGFGMPAGGYGSPVRNNMGAPMATAAPVNRFAPPNAPGVRPTMPSQQFAAAGQMGSARDNLMAGRAPLSNAVAQGRPANYAAPARGNIPVQSARTVTRRR